MNFQESIDYLEKEIGFASVPGLERIQNLLDKLGNPQESYKTIHIAGTNGKGSATAMLSSILMQTGQKIATYTSPHLERYNERFIINGVEISDERFAEIMTETKASCDALREEGKEVPTLFEVVTAAGFLYFAKENVDIAVIEVGLGGRFDATNVMKTPLLSMIMSISLDHTEYLGTTIAQIAMEKGGIIKKNCPTVLYSQDKVVYNMIGEIATSLQSPLTCLQDATVSVSSQTLEGTIFDVTTELFSYEGVYLPLLGHHQIQNCLTVLAACHVLVQNGIALTKEHILEGLRRAKWAGRMEVFHSTPLTIIDGAHNVDGIARLSESISTYLPNTSLTLVLGVLGDKEYEEMANTILPLAKQVIFTEPHSERKLSANILANIAKNKNIPYFVEQEIPNAFQKAVEITEPNEAILCCGSLYMIGDLRKHVVAFTKGGNENVQF